MKVTHRAAIPTERSEARRHNSTPIRASIRFVVSHPCTLTEAVPVATAPCGGERTRDRRVGIIIGGGNVDPAPSFAASGG